MMKKVFINLNKIEVFLFIFIFITPLYFFASQHSIFTVLLGIIFLFKYKGDYIYKIKKVFSNKAIILIFLYFFYTYLSLFWTSDLEHGIAVQKVYREALFYIPLLYIFFDKKNIKNAFILLTISFSLYAIYSIGIYLGLYTVVNSSIYNPQGYLGSYEKVCFMMSLGCIFSIILLYFEKNKILRILFIGTFLFCVFALFINNGRSSQISFFFMLSTFSIFKWKKNYSLKKVFLFLLIFISLLSIFFINSARVNTGYNEIKKSIENNDYEGSWGTRLYMYITGIKIIKNNFIFGVGAGDSKSAYRKIAMEENSPHAWYSHMHNQHIEYLSRYGILGYSLLLASVFMLLFSIRKDKLYFMLGISFYCITFYNGLFNDILDRKPLHVLFFMIFAILSTLNKKEDIKN